MKLKQTIAVSILAIVGLSSCEKNLYDPSQEVPKTDIKDLVISDDFSWKMTENASCSVTSNDAVMVSIYRDASYNKGSLLATIPVKSGDTPILPLAVLDGMQTVYIEYEYAQQPGEIKKTTAAVQDGKIQFTVPNSTITRAGSTRADDGDFTNKGGTIFYPSLDGGTVMFEDNYPELGDYDFNDFVAYYRIEIETYPNLKDVKSINFYMTVNAIGATYKYIPHLRLNAFTIPSLDGDILVGNEGFDNLDVKLLSDAKPGEDGKIVLAFNGAEDKAGQNFYNTEKGSQAILPRKFDVTMNFKPGCDLRFLEIEKFDIFLASSDQKKEIHMLGFGTAFDSENYTKLDMYKDAKTNLVWGINIPAIVDHAYEKAKFNEAYPKFVDWVTNKSNTANDWYKYGVAEFIFTMTFK